MPHAACEARPSAKTRAQHNCCVPFAKMACHERMQVTDTKHAGCQRLLTDVSQRLHTAESVIQLANQKTRILAVAISRVCARFSTRLRRNLVAQHCTVTPHHCRRCIIAAAFNPQHQPIVLILRQPRPITPCRPPTYASSYTSTSVGCIPSTTISNAFSAVVQRRACCGGGGCAPGRVYLGQACCAPGGQGGGSGVISGEGCDADQTTRTLHATAPVSVMSCTHTSLTVMF
jgi:hypothetical protein